VNVSSNCNNNNAVIFLTQCVQGQWGHYFTSYVLTFWWCSRLVIHRTFVWLTSHFYHIVREHLSNYTLVRYYYSYASGCCIQQVNPYLSKIYRVACQSLLYLGRIQSRCILGVTCDQQSLYSLLTDMAETHGNPHFDPCLVSFHKLTHVFLYCSSHLSPIAHPFFFTPCFIQLSPSSLRAIGMKYGSKYDFLSPVSSLRFHFDHDRILMRQAASSIQRYTLAQ
jgi:hypothetical protein